MIGMLIMLVLAFSEILGLFFSEQTTATRYNRCPLFLRNVKVELFPSFMRNRNVTI